MSKFDTAIFILQGRGHPLFDKMAETRVPLPMAKGMRAAVMSCLPADLRPEDRAVISSAVVMLSRSTRYLQVSAEAGAMRHNLWGQPTEPVSDMERKWANAMLVRKEKFVAQNKARAAAKAKKMQPPSVAEPEGRSA